ncbi:MAG TPA: copper chaperone PCu(A)C [Candidatus Nanopelagicales bacterium]
MPARRLPLVAAALLLATAVGPVSGCAGSTPATSTTSVAGTAAAGCPVSVTDPWVKATDTQMTGVFGTITADEAIVVTGASSSVAGRAEIHEVVQADGAAVMRPKAGGLTIPAGGSAILAPGGDHIMLMALSAPIQPGDEVPVTLACSDGSTAAFTAVAKPFEGGAESYVPAEGSMGEMASPGASPAA